MRVLRLAARLAIALVAGLPPLPGTLVASAGAEGVRDAPMQGDLNGDGKVDKADLVYFVQKWRQRVQTGDVDPAADINGDGKLDHNDAVQVVEVTTIPAPGTNGTVQFGRDVYFGTGDSGVVIVRDNDLGSTPSVQVRVFSELTEPVGEVVTLGNVGSGRFRGTVNWERPFTSTEALTGLQGNGNVCVYAEGGRVSEKVTVEYTDARRPGGQAQVLTAETRYEEPPSTLAGTVMDGDGKPITGALVLLGGPEGYSAQAVSRAGDHAGQYAFYGLSSGEYGLTVMVDGFAQQSWHVTIYAEPGRPTAATLTLSKASYSGTEDAASITLVDADQTGEGTAVVTVRSAVTDPTGETVTLNERPSQPGTFVGSVKWERPFSETASTPVTAGNGRVGVYAEAGIASEPITCEYSDITHPSGYSDTVVARAMYEEPSSTLTGIVTDGGGGPIAGAAIRLVAADGSVRNATSRSGSGYVGHYSLYGLAAGTYSLTIAVNGYAAQTTTVTIAEPQ